jgi:hypothetical protein
MEIRYKRSCTSISNSIIVLDFTEGKARMRRKFRRNEKTYIEYQSKAEKILENLSPVQLPTESIIESWKVKSEKKQSRLLDSPNEIKEEIIKETGDAEEVLEGTSSDEVDEKKIELQGVRSENQPGTSLNLIGRLTNINSCRYRGCRLGRS